MESPEESEAETEAGGRGVGVEVDDDAAGGFAEEREELAEDDCAENGRADDARALRVLLLHNGRGVEPDHSGALVEACPRARRGRGGSLEDAVANSCVAVEDDAAAPDDDVAIRPCMFFGKGGRERRFDSPLDRVLRCCGDRE